MVVSMELLSKEGATEAVFLPTQFETITLQSLISNNNNDDESSKNLDKIHLSVKVVLQDFPPKRPRDFPSATATEQRKSKRKKAINGD